MWTWATVAIATVVLAAAYWYYSRPAAGLATNSGDISYVKGNKSYTYNPATGKYVESVGGDASYVMGNKAYTYDYATGKYIELARIPS